MVILELPKYNLKLNELIISLSMEGFDVQRANKIAQDIYDSETSSLLSKKLNVTSNSGISYEVTEDHVFATYPRGIYIFNGAKMAKLTLEVKRIKLPDEDSHALLPNSLVPYKPLSYFGVDTIDRFFKPEIYGSSVLNADIETMFGDSVVKAINNSFQIYNSSESETKIYSTIDAFFTSILADILKFVKHFFDVSKQVFLVNRIKPQAGNCVFSNSVKVYFAHQ